MISALEIKGENAKLEDRITSSFFDYLFLLPEEMIWNIIRDSCNDKLLKNAGELKEYKFWPSWDPSGTKNKNFVEPDLFIRFKEFVIIIEAKQENNSQYNEQWENELRSFLNEHKDNDIDEKNVYLLAIDGKINNSEKENLITIWKKEKKSFPVIKTKWQILYETIRRYKNNNKEFKQNSLILSLIIRYLEHFVIFKITWPEEVKWQKEKKSDFMISMNTLDNMYKNYTEVNIIDKTMFFNILLFYNNQITNFKSVMEILNKTGEEYDRF